MKVSIPRKILVGMAYVGNSRMVLSLALIAAGMLAGTALPPGAARGDVKDAAQPQSFQTGDQLALPILKDIATTLHQMDARLMKMEAIAQHWRTKQGNAAGQK